MKRLKIFLNGLIYENPILVIFLGMCPALGTTDMVEKAVYMSLCVFAVLILSNIIISSIRKIVPNEVRIPVFIIIIATLVSIVDMLFHAYLPYSVYEALAGFISLIVVNCIILGRAESFASKNGVVDSIIDAVGYSAGFALAIIVVAFFREVLGTGSLSWGGNTISLFEDIKLSLFNQPAGAFITLGIVVAVYTYVMDCIKNRKNKVAVKSASSK